MHGPLESALSAYAEAELRVRASRDSLLQGKQPQLQLANQFAAAPKRPSASPQISRPASEPTDDAAVNSALEDMRRVSQSYKLDAAELQARVEKEIRLKQEEAEAQARLSQQAAEAAAPRAMPPPLPAPVVSPPTTATPTQALDEKLVALLESSRKFRKTLQEDTHRLAKNKLVNHAKLHVTSLAGTELDVCVRVDGTQDKPGPRALLSYVTKNAPAQLEAVMRVLAHRFVQVVQGNSVGADQLRYGDTNYALAYVALACVEAFPAFRWHLEGAMIASCPYVAVGLKETIELEYASAKGSQSVSKEEQTAKRREDLGYQSPEETDDLYLLRMQATVAWYGAMLQTRPEHPPPELGLRTGGACLGGLTAAWRWAAGTMNAQAWRWTRFLLQAFLVVTGHELSLLSKKQTFKLVKTLEQACRAGRFQASHVSPSDDDRTKVFQSFLEESLQGVERGGVFPTPRNVMLKNDPRKLPRELEANQG